jgi:hypothetical protein
MENLDGDDERTRNIITIDRKSSFDSLRDDQLSSKLSRNNNRKMKNSKSSSHLKKSQTNFNSHRDSIEKHQNLTQGLKNLMDQSLKRRASLD